MSRLLLFLGLILSLAGVFGATQEEIWKIYAGTTN